MGDLVGNAQEVCASRGGAVLGAPHGRRRDGSRNPERGASADGRIGIPGATRVQEPRASALPRQDGQHFRHQRRDGLGWPGNRSIKGHCAPALTQLPRPGPLVSDSHQLLQGIHHGRAVVGSGQRGDHRLGVSSVGLFSFETWAPVHYWVPVLPLMPLRLSAGLHQVVLVGTTGLEMQSSLNRGGFYYFIFFWGGRPTAALTSHCFIASSQYISL